MTTETIIALICVGFTCGVVGLFIGFLMGKIDKKIIVMAQYIDKAALVAEIEKWLGETDKGFPNDHNLGRYDMCKKMLSFINSLEVKEIDSNDSFIEKAAKWLEDNAVKYWGTDAVDNGMMIYDFKNAMKL